MEKSNVSPLRIAELSLGTMRASKNYDQSLIDVLEGLIEHSREQQKEIEALKTSAFESIIKKSAFQDRQIAGINNIISTYHPQ